MDELDVTNEVTAATNEMLSTPAEFSAIADDDTYVAESDMTYADDVAPNGTSPALVAYSNNLADYLGPRRSTLMVQQLLITRFSLALLIPGQHIAKAWVISRDGKRANALAQSGQYQEAIEVATGFKEEIDLYRESDSFRQFVALEISDASGFTNLMEGLTGDTLRDKPIKSNWKRAGKILLGAVQAVATATSGRGGALGAASRNAPLVVQRGRAQFARRLPRLSLKQKYLESRKLNKLVRLSNGQPDRILRRVQQFIGGKTTLSDRSILNHFKKEVANARKTYAQKLNQNRAVDNISRNKLLSEFDDKAKRAMSKLTNALVHRRKLQQVFADQRGSTSTGDL